MTINTRRLTIKSTSERRRLITSTALPIWTPLQIVGGQLPENIPTFGQSTPIGRAGQPAELAGAYVFLASNESSYVTGESINVTGGLK